MYADSTGEYAVCLNADAGAELWRELDGHASTYAVMAVAFNYDGSVLVACAEDRMINVWDPHEGRLLYHLGAHQDAPVEKCRRTLQHIEYTMHFTAFYG